MAVKKKYDSAGLFFVHKALVAKSEATTASQSCHPVSGIHRNSSAGQDRLPQAIHITAPTEGS
jgi:hypothetical protein